MSSPNKKQIKLATQPSFGYSAVQMNHSQDVQMPISQQQLRRYSQIPIFQKVPHKRPNRESRITNFKSEHPTNRKRSLTPTSIYSKTHLQLYQCQFRQIEMILQKKNENLQQQNEFLKSQICKLYERQNKFKTSAKKYKLKIRQLNQQNQQFQKRLTILKQSVTEILGRFTLAIQTNAQEAIQNCSKDLANKLKQGLSTSDQNLQATNKFFSNNFLDLDEKDLEFQEQYQQPVLNNIQFNDTQPAQFFEFDETEITIKKTNKIK